MEQLWQYIPADEGTQVQLAIAAGFILWSARRTLLPLAMGALMVLSVVLLIYGQGLAGLAALAAMLPCMVVMWCDSWADEERRKSNR